MPEQDSLLAAQRVVHNYPYSKVLQFHQTTLRLVLFHFVKEPNTILYVDVPAVVGLLYLLIKLNNKYVHGYNITIILIMSIAQNTSPTISVIQAAMRERISPIKKYNALKLNRNSNKNIKFRKVRTNFQHLLKWKSSFILLFVLTHDVY